MTERIEVPVIEHKFIAGMYFRLMKIPRGHIATTHAHTYDHASICLSGLGALAAGERKVPVAGGGIYTVEKGVQHAIEAYTDLVWMCAHDTAKHSIDSILRVIRDKAPHVLDDVIAAIKTDVDDLENVVIGLMKE